MVKKEPGLDAMDKLDKLDKLDDFYNDPYTDMEIISKEGTMFWVSQHRLKKTSEDFNKLLALATPANAAKLRRTIVPLPYSADAIRHYLDIVSASQVQATPCILDLAQSRELYIMGRALVCSRVVQLVLPCLIELERPGLLFELACQHNDDITLLEAGLDKLAQIMGTYGYGSGSTGSSLQTFKVDVCKLPERYSTQLAHQMFHAIDETGYHGSHYQQCPRWSWVRKPDRVQAYIQGVQAGAEERAKEQGNKKRKI